MMNLVSVKSGEKFNAENAIWQGPAGDMLDLEFSAKFDLKKIAAAKPNLWRYQDAIPVAPENAMSFEEGFTPMLSLAFGKQKLLIKQEHLFPSGSYKDRGATVMMSHARSIGVKHVVQDSSGNAGCAVAAYSAKAKIACDIFVPADTSPAKLVQIELYGAKIHKVPGSREDTAAAAMAAAKKSYYASHCWNPFFFHGTKTFAYEICEQLGWKTPDAVVLPAGNGTLVLGCAIGFQDLMKAGIIDRMPKLIAIQSEGCEPLTHAFNKNLSSVEIIPTTPTLAEGIAIAAPLRGSQILSAVRDSKGMIFSVTEEEIKRALLTCVHEGFYIEPTSAATIAGALKYGENHSGELVVTLFTGHGLKSTEKLQKFI